MSPKILHRAWQCDSYALCKILERSVNYKKKQVFTLKLISDEFLDCCSPLKYDILAVNYWYEDVLMIKLFCQSKTPMIHNYIIARNADSIFDIMQWQLSVRNVKHKQEYAHDENLMRGSTDLPLVQCIVLVKMRHNLTCIHSHNLTCIHSVMPL